MKYIYRQHHSKLATLMIGFPAGSRVEFQSKYPKGISHYIEHARFLGTQNKNKYLLAKEIALCGGSWNAFTSYDMVCYHIVVPEENLEQACRVLADVVIHPAFPEEELNKEKEVVCQEIRMYADDIGSLIGDYANSYIFSNSSASPIVGSEETVTAITRQDVLDFNNEFYSHNKMGVILTAANDHQDILNKYFGQIDDEIQLTPKVPVVEYAPSILAEVVKDGLLQNTIMVAFGSQDMRYLSDFDAKTTMFNRVFGASDVSRLFVRIREELGLVYGIYSRFDDRLDGMLFKITTITEPDNQDKVLKAIDEEIERFFKEPPTQEELTMAKNKFKSCMYGSLDSPNIVANYALDQLFYGNKSIQEVLADVEAITVEDILSVAKVVFNSNKYTIIGHS